MTTPKNKKPSNKTTIPPTTRSTRSQGRPPQIPQEEAEEGLLLIQGPRKSVGKTDTELSDWKSSDDGDHFQSGNIESTRPVTPHSSPTLNNTEKALSTRRQPRGAAIRAQEATRKIIAPTPVKSNRATVVPKPEKCAVRTGITTFAMYHGQGGTTPPAHWASKWQEYHPGPTPEKETEPELENILSSESVEINEKEQTIALPGVSKPSLPKRKRRVTDTYNPDTRRRRDRERRKRRETERLAALANDDQSETTRTELTGGSPSEQLLKEASKDDFVARREEITHEQGDRLAEKLDTGFDDDILKDAERHLSGVANCELDKVLNDADTNLRDIGSDVIGQINIPITRSRASSMGYRLTFGGGDRDEEFQPVTTTDQDDASSSSLSFLEEPSDMTLPPISFESITGNCEQFPKNQIVQQKQPPGPDEYTDTLSILEDVGRHLVASPDSELSAEDVINGSSDSTGETEPSERTEDVEIDPDQIASEPPSLTNSPIEDGHTQNTVKALTFLPVDVSQLTIWPRSSRASSLPIFTPTSRGVLRASSLPPPSSSPPITSLILDGFPTDSELHIPQAASFGLVDDSQSGLNAIVQDSSIATNLEVEPQINQSSTTNLENGHNDQVDSVYINEISLIPENDTGTILIEPEASAELDDVAISTQNKTLQISSSSIVLNNSTLRNEKIIQPQSSGVHIVGRQDTLLLDKTSQLDISGKYNSEGNSGHSINNEGEPHNQHVVSQTPLIVGIPPPGSEEPKNGHFSLQNHMLGQTSSIHQELTISVDNSEDVSMIDTNKQVRIESHMDDKPDVGGNSRTLDRAEEREPLERDIACNSTKESNQIDLVSNGDTNEGDVKEEGGIEDDRIEDDANDGERGGKDRKFYAFVEAQNSTVGNPPPKDHELEAAVLLSSLGKFQASDVENNDSPVSPQPARLPTIEKPDSPPQSPPATIVAIDDESSPRIEWNLEKVCKSAAGSNAICPICNANMDEIVQIWHTSNKQEARIGQFKKVLSRQKIIEYHVLGCLEKPDGDLVSIFDSESEVLSEQEDRTEETDDTITPPASPRVSYIPDLGILRDTINHVANAYNGAGTMTESHYRRVLFLPNNTPYYLMNELKDTSRPMPERLASAEALTFYLYILQGEERTLSQIIQKVSEETTEYSGTPFSMSITRYLRSRHAETKRNLRNPQIQPDLKWNEKNRVLLHGTGPTHNTDEGRGKTRRQTAQRLPRLIPGYEAAGEAPPAPVTRSKRKPGTDSTPATTPAPTPAGPTTETGTVTTAIDSAGPPRRGPGRPKKTPIPAVTPVTTSTTTSVAGRVTRGSISSGTVGDSNGLSRPNIITLKVASAHLQEVRTGTTSGDSTGDVHDEIVDYDGALPRKRAKLDPPVESVKRKRGRPTKAEKEAREQRASAAAAAAAAAASQLPPTLPNSRLLPSELVNTDLSGEKGPSSGFTVIPESETRQTIEEEFQAAAHMDLGKRKRRESGPTIPEELVRACETAIRKRRRESIGDEGN